MKIPLVVRQRYGEFLPFGRIAIKGMPVGLLALVDTGSPWTVITPMGSTMLKLDRTISHLDIPPRDHIVVFAGHSFKRYLAGNLEVCMKNNEGKLVTFNKPTIGVLVPQKKMDPKEFKEVPFILGCDFLRTNKLVLTFDPDQQVAYLS